MGHLDEIDYASIVRLERFCKSIIDVLDPEQRYSKDAVYELSSKLDSLMYLVQHCFTDYPIAPLLEEARYWKVGEKGQITQEDLLNKTLQVIGIITLFYDGPLQHTYLGKPYGD
jgi:hypothetical protein